MLKSASQHLYEIDLLLPSQLSWKKSLLLTCQILGMPVNTLDAYGKYFFLNRVSLTIPIQMQDSQKEKFFCQFLAAFSNLAKISTVLKKKGDPHRFCLFEVTDSENVFLNLWTPRT